MSETSSCFDFETEEEPKQISSFSAKG